MSVLSDYWVKNHRRNTSKNGSADLPAASRPYWKRIRANIYCAAPFGACMLVLSGALITQIVLVSGGGLLSITSLSRVALDHIPSFTHPAPVELNTVNAARITWVSSAFLHAVLCIFSIAAGWTLITRGPLTILHTDRKHRAKPATLQVLLGSGLLGWAIVYLVPQQEITGQLLDVIMHNESNGHVVGNVLKILDVLTFGAAIFLVVLSSFALKQPCEYAEMLSDDMRAVPISNDELHKLCHYMAEQARECRIVFYLGTAVLVTAILRLHTFYGWAITYFVQEDAKNQFGLPSLLETAASAWGTYATLILFAMFFPTFIILRSRAFRLVQRAHPEMTQEAQEKWLERHKLITSNIQYIVKAVAILSPFMVGKLSEVIKNF